MIRTVVRRAFPLFALPLILVACAPGDRQLTEEEVLAAAAELHPSLLTIDTHIDIGLDYATEEMNPCLGTDSKVDVPKMKAGGMDVGFFAVYVGQRERTPEGYAAVKEQAMTKFTAIHRMAEEMCPEEIEIPYTADDIERIHSEGKLIAGIGIENGFAIGQDLSLLETYFDLGTRYMTLTHSGHNDIGDSSGPSERLGDAQEEHGGLSDFGREVVAEMNRLGIIVDVSHVSKKTMLDVVGLSQAPIIASHSSVKAIADHNRNLDDEQLLALRDNGGVIHVCALGGFLMVDPPEKQAAMAALREELGFTGRGGYGSLTDEQIQEYRARRAELDEQWPGADVQTYVNHIDYVVDMIGIDHVGIGTDFDGGGGITGFNDASEAMNVTAELIRRGYSDDDVRKIWGGNFIRVLREVEEVAAGNR